MPPSSVMVRHIIAMMLFLLPCSNRCMLAGIWGVPYSSLLWRPSSNEDCGAILFISPCLETARMQGLCQFFSPFGHPDLASFL